MIVANNVYAHIPDIQGVTRAISQALSDEGVFIFEVHYLDKIINEMQYDMIYHEHLYYYSLISAKKHFSKYGLTIFDVKQIPIHGGSIRFYVCKDGSKNSEVINESVNLLEREEIYKGYNKYTTFKKFSDKVALHKSEMIELLSRLKAAGNKIVGYGASGRANTMIQYCEITHQYLDYIVDDAPAKIGLMTPGSHFQIFSSDILLNTDPPDYVLVFAWSFFDEIEKRNKKYLSHGGRMIVPLPVLKIYTTKQ